MAIIFRLLGSMFRSEKNFLDINIVKCIIVFHQNSKRSFSLGFPNSKVLNKNNEKSKNLLFN